MTRERKSCWCLAAPFTFHKHGIDRAQAGPYSKGASLIIKEKARSCLWSNGVPFFHFPSFCHLCMAVSIGPCSPSHVYSHPFAQLNLFSGRDFISHQTMLFQYHYVWSHWLEPLDHFMVHDYAVAPLEPKRSPDSLKWSLGRELSTVSFIFVKVLFGNADDWCAGFTSVRWIYTYYCDILRAVLAMPRDTVICCLVNVKTRHHR